MPKDKNLDDLIQEAFHEKAMRFPPPPMSASESWEKMQKRMQGRNENINPKPLYRKFWMAVASLFLIIGTISLWPPQHGSAFGKLTEIFHKIQGTMTHLFIKVGDVHEGENAPSSDVFTVVEGSEITTESMSLEEAQKVTAFTIIVPKYVPSPFQLKQVTVLRAGNEQSEEVYLHYEANGQGFTITEKKLHEQFGFGMVFDHEDTKIEEINMNGQKVNLLIYKNGVSQLIWTTQDHYLSIEGKVPKEEIIQIAKSM